MTTTRRALTLIATLALTAALAVPAAATDRDEATVRLLVDTGEVDLSELTSGYATTSSNGDDPVIEHAPQLDAAAIEVDAATAADLRRRYPTAVEDEFTYHLTGTVSAPAWPAPVRRIAAPDTIHDPSPIKVAVLDTGIAPLPDLNVAAHYDCISTDVGVCQPGRPPITNNHGTAAAGIIAATGHTPTAVGVAPGATLIDYRIVNDAEAISPIRTAAAIVHAVEVEQVDVINMSFGGIHPPRQVVLDAVAVAEAAGVTLVGGAGNNDTEARRFSPANITEVVSVSAIADTDGLPGGLGERRCDQADDEHTTYTNYGADVDLAAPGSCLPTINRDGLPSSMSGTSAATPMVVGAVVHLLASSSADRNGARPAWVRDQLVTAVSVPQDSPCGYTATKPDSTEPLLHLGACDGVDRPAIEDAPQTPPAPEPTPEPTPEPEPTPPSTPTPPRPAPSPATFADVPSGYTHAPGITWAQANGVIGGYGDGTFRPTQPVTRAALATMLHRLAGAPAPARTATFADVPSTHPHAAGIAWAQANGVISGYGDGTFRPSQPVTRQALATMLHRDTGSPQVAASQQRFRDVPNGHTHAAGIAWAESVGLVRGYGDGTFRPADRVTRAAAATVLHRNATR